MGLERLVTSAGAGMGTGIRVIGPDEVRERWKEKNSDILMQDEQMEDQEAGDCFKIVEISGKGTGMVSQKKLYPGDLIMTEKPLIEVPGIIYDNLAKVVKYLDKVVDRMSSSDREVFLNLTDCQRPADPSYLGIFDTNDMDFGGSGAVFPVMARVNHSCQPNAEFVSDQERRIQRLVAIGNIDKEGEITINYLPMEEEGSDVKKRRQQFLKKHYCFTCTCCSKENQSLSQDDLLRETVKEMQAAGHQKLSIEELEFLISLLCEISSKYGYILQVLDAIYKLPIVVQGQVYRLSSAVRGLSLASSLYGWTDVRTGMWRDRAELEAVVFTFKKFR